MVFGCFKKEKDPSKKKKKTKKGSKDHAVEVQDGQSAANAAPQIASDNATHEKESPVHNEGKASAKTPRATADQSASSESSSASNAKDNGKLVDPRSPRAETTPRAADAPASPRDATADSVATTTNRDALISSESSHPAVHQSPPVSPRSAATPSVPPKPNSLLTRSGSQVKSTSPVTPRSVRIEGVHAASAVPSLASGSATSSPAVAGEQPISPRRISSASSSRRGSVSGRSNSISNNDMNRIYRETDEQVASARARIFERKMTLQHDLAASMEQIERDKIHAQRASVLLGLDALDTLDLDHVEAEIATFREEEYCEEALEEKLVNEKILHQLETDVQDSKRKIDEMKDDSDSLDLDDLNSLEDKLDDIEDGSGSDDEVPSYKSTPMSPISTYDEPLTAETATIPEGESGSFSAAATPRNGAQDVEPVA